MLLALFFGNKKIGMKERIVNYASYVISAIVIYLIFNYRAFVYEIAPNKLYLSNPNLAIMLFKESLVSLSVTLTLLGLLILPVGVYSCINEKRRKGILILIALWFLPYYLYISLVQTFSASFLIPVLVPLILVVSLGLDYIYRRLKVAGMAIFLLLLVSFLLVILPVVKSRHDYCGPKEFALFVERITEDSSYIIANDESVFFHYYAGRETLSYPEFAGPQTVAKVVKQYYDFLMGGGTIYATDKLFYYSDPQQSALVTLDTIFILEKIGSAENEEYDHAELRNNIRNESIYRLHINPEIPLEKFRIMALGID